MNSKKDNIYSWRDFSAAALAKKKSAHRISVIIPTLNESGTVGKIIRMIRRELMEEHPLVDEIIVLDGGSSDGTRTIARRAGAAVYRDIEVAPWLSNFCGKGNALYKSYFASTGDIIAFIDGDIKNFTPRFITGIVGPLLVNDDISFVKAFYKRPLKVSGRYKAGEGGRVTEILARPVLNTFFPALADIRQPLSGEYAIRRKLFRKISIPSGYGVEIAFLIEILYLAGRKAIAQADIGERRHRNQSLHALGKMSFEVLHSFLHYARKVGKLHVKDISENYYDLKENSIHKISQKYHEPVRDLFKSTEIIFLRHGETDWNREKRIQSRHDTPLNSNGKKQALRTAAALKKEKICAVYSSPLSRALDTAQIIAGQHGLPVRKDERLLEISHGSWSGKKESWLSQKYPEKYSQWKKAPWKHLPPKAESWQELKKRMESFISYIKSAHGGEKIVVVSHRGAIAMAAAIIRKKPLKYINNYLPANCSPVKIKL
ncbi:glucosyl-3-phosphoglycerate synthase [bacterium]|nr:glucosyl-3-phosphoglycerate synthase [bacterium]MBU3956332.1 glucosyl-3-phosphoglycerate synthase [bacterium]MBU4134703.1 glucosyl-3-phosphoglycerate synthase [bacterium]